METRQRMAVDKERAQSLRLTGKTYAEIAQTIGCSVAWCKANLKGIVAPNNDAPLITEIVQRGLSRAGITNGEIVQLTKQHNPTLAHKQLSLKVQQIKRLALKQNKDVVIRPYWLVPDLPQDSVNTMMDTAQSIYERINTAALEFRSKYGLDETHHKSVFYSLCSLCSGEGSPLLPQGILSYGDYLTSIIEKLDDRKKE